MDRRSKTRAWRTRRIAGFAPLAFLTVWACQPEDSTPVIGPGDPAPGITLAQQVEGQYDGTWTIEILPNIGVSGTCPGHVIIRAETIRERLAGTQFTGTYFIDALDDCLAGSTVSGEVLNGSLREDGGVNFGLDVPRSDGNFFEDILAGSGVNLNPVDAVGCDLDVADLNNHMDGSIVNDRLRAANSARVTCRPPVIVTGDTLNDVTLRITIDAAR